jgi:hypothetical protein
MPAPLNFADFLDQVRRADLADTCLSDQMAHGAPEELTVLPDERIAH